MRLKEFLTIEEVEAADGNLDQEVSGLTYDSRAAGNGQMFFAVAGEKVDGHDYIAAAVHQGAAGYVYSRPGSWPTEAAAIRVADVRRALGLWSAHFYRRPSSRLKLIGVTGTNGKTTLTYLLESILNSAQLTPGVLGTINYRYGAQAVPAHHTTPESLDIEELLAQMVGAGVKAVAMEVSSHALVQERVRGLEFDIGVFTNLSRDHLDYHRDMDDYFLAKSRLFSDYLGVSPKRNKAAVIYGDDPRGAELAQMARAHGLEVWTYGANASFDVHPLNVSQSVDGLHGKISARGRSIDCDSPLIGGANLQNILGAAAVGSALGLDAGIVGDGIRQLKLVPGRVEKVGNDRGITILVDYAHTPDALEKVLTAVRPLTGGRLIAVFGCGGDRDRGKRPLMGEIAARLSDRVMVTSDNPRTEEPLVILDEIEVGVKKTGMHRLRVSSDARGYSMEVDRRLAIRSALSWAQAGDLVLIAGKGHEDYQILGKQKIHFDDREVARQELGARAGV
ncbi:MAG: UDP-N-acetylmuramoyl-L-alanyl-D-glutamate--2,6-diaminopimelate ligase [Deltaproteobacteria bacterium]|nr:UDP-N-acetylmuramoyl-L-alanyl-D-glutamate--2,6-diaminopimelate ligase [Deltaproteobacteria bacterium]